MRLTNLIGTLILSGVVVFGIPTGALAHGDEQHDGESNDRHEALHERLDDQHDDAHQRLRQQHSQLHERLENSNLSPEQKRRIHNSEHDKLQGAHDKVHQQLRRKHAAAHNNPPRPTPTVDRPTPAPVRVARPAPAPVRDRPAATPVRTRR
jgi:hypothetical protein